MALVRIVLILCLAFVLSVCSESSDGGDGGDGADVVDAGGGDDGAARDADAGGGDTASPPLLDSSHMGWRSQHCDLCHSLPRPGHTTSHPPDCAACHGGNGACDPGYSGRVHSRTENCTACHQNKHDFSSNSDCTSCHYAFAQTIDCDQGTVLSNELESGCFNWPAEEFTTDNHAEIQTIAEGGLAVEFILKDVDGTAYTLSGLLAEKPVLMVFGAYT
jgi:hypothetical protein